MAHHRDFTDTAGMSEGDQIFALIDRYAARVSRRAAGTESNVRILSPEQRARLRDVPFAGPDQASWQTALEQYATGIAAVMHAAAAFVDLRAGGPTVIASSAGGALAAALKAFGEAQPLIIPSSARARQRHDDGGVFIWRADHQEWTVVPFRSATWPLALVIQGEWSLSGPMLRALVRKVERALSVSDGRSVPLGLRRAHRLARVLARVHGVQRVCKTALEHVVGAVPSTSGVFAVPDANGMLTIAATHGYPLSLVSHIRIAPGDGVIGAVYERRAPMRVDDATRLYAGRAPRPHYRGTSFVAVPALAGREVLGVLAITERVPDGPYTRGDVSAIRTLMAPISLALARERARQDAESMTQAAVVDPVSGLFNRRYFEARLEEELQPARRVKPTVGLLMIDIDNFKRVNDTHGHVVGDAVIRGVAAVLRDAVRASDITTRFGGEEFAVLLPRSDARSAGGMAERIRRRIEEFRLEGPSVADLEITVSVGVATSSPTTTAAQLIGHADAALYRAKREGRNRVCNAVDDAPTP